LGKLGAADLIDAACVHLSIIENISTCYLTTAKYFVTACLGFGVVRLHILEGYFEIAPGM
jgi:hypothetical protein